MKKKILTLEEEKDIKLKRSKESCGLCHEPFYRYWLSPERYTDCYECRDKFPKVGAEFKNRRD